MARFIRSGDPRSRFCPTKAGGLPGRAQSPTHNTQLSKDHSFLQSAILNWAAALPSSTRGSNRKMKLFEKKVDPKGA